MDFNEEEKRALAEGGYTELYRFLFGMFGAGIQQIELTRGKLVVHLLDDTREIITLTETQSRKLELRLGNNVRRDHLYRIIKEQMELNTRAALAALDYYEECMRAINPFLAKVPSVPSKQ